MSLPAFSPGRAAALPLHFVGRLPGSDDHLADATHRLGIGRHHADGAQVVQHVFGGDGFGADAGFGERHIFRNRGTKVMADHQHVQMLVKGIHRERHRRIRRRGQAVRLAANANNVGRVPATGALSMVGVDRASLESTDGVLHKPGFIQRICVNGHLHVKLVGNGESAIDSRGRGAPIFMKFQADCAGLDLLAQRIGERTIPLAEKT